MHIVKYSKKNYEHTLHLFLTVLMLHHHNKNHVFCNSKKGDKTLIKIALKRIQIIQELNQTPNNTINCLTIILKFTYLNIHITKKHIHTTYTFLVDLFQNTNCTTNLQSYLVCPFIFSIILNFVCLIWGRSLR